MTYEKNHFYANMNNLYPLSKCDLTHFEMHLMKMFLSTAYNTHLPYQVVDIKDISYRTQTYANNIGIENLLMVQDSYL